MISRMRFACITLAISGALVAQDSVTRARQLEDSGSAGEAIELLRESIRSGLPANLAAYAELLDRRNHPDTRAAYEKLIAANPSAAQKTRALRRLVALDLLAGDHDAARKHLADYRAAGGTDLGASIPTPATPALATISVPGPIRSFARMAALSPDLGPADLLPALARNIVTNGYQASNSPEALDQTEYLKLVFRYLSQARELERLATDGDLKVETCDSAQTGELLKVLGYRMRGGCGADVVLETVNASRAFLTIDSGFPLAELEQALRTNRPFVYDYRPVQVPVLHGPEYWMGANDKKEKTEFIDAFMSDPSLCRLYLGLSKLDEETSEELRKAVPVTRLRAFAHVLDFFGGMFLIRGGKAVAPGGARSEAMWAELAGSPPSQGAQFIEKLLTREDGWLAAYFDSLSRIEGPTLAYLTSPERMKRFYQALRGKVTSPGPARPVFRSNTDLMLLTTRLWLEKDGTPHLPGGLEMWKNLFIKHPHGKYDGKLTKAAVGWKEGDDVIEALFALCRKAVENEPLKIYMALSDLDRYRSTPVTPELADRLARNWRVTSSQFPVLAEFADMSPETIVTYLDTMEAIVKIRNQEDRADAAGTMQALTGIWQIFVRNGLIPAAQADTLLRDTVKPFLTASKPEDIFSAGAAGSRGLLAAAGSAAGASAQDRMLALLAGSASPDSGAAHQELVQEMIMLFEAQKLVSLKTILDLDGHLEAIGKGEAFNPAFVNRLQARMQELQLPRASLTGAERNALSFGYWTEKHIDNERKSNLRQLLEKPGIDAGRIAEARSRLAPILRDTLVGFNYLYYAPPAAQIMRTNPVFVRSHDFLGIQGTNQTWRQTEVLGTGWPSSAGGRLVGSLSGLPYALAEAEQNFMIPSREQALIWGDLVPQMIVMAKVPRWWNATPRQLHWVGLHLRQAETLLAESALSKPIREATVQALARSAAPARASKVEKLLAGGNVAEARDNVTASELYQIAADHFAREPQSTGVYASEIRRIAGATPNDVSPEAISKTFGTPKPTLTSSYRRELLHLRTFPTLMGYSSRLMAESWESNVLYYAALADQMNLRPGDLNVRVPDWTRRTVERIFATHLEDWPALLRSLRYVSEDVRVQAKNSAGGSPVGGGN